MPFVASITFTPITKGSRDQTEKAGKARNKPQIKGLQSVTFLAEQYSLNRRSH
jgi:hypothetical protein